jgi:hypothetical protein
MLRGTVNNIDIKMVTTKFGNKPTYTLTINGDRYSSGFTKPGVSVGDEVQFDFASGKYGNDIVKGSLTKVGGGAAAPSPAPHEAPASTSVPKNNSAAGYKPFPIPLLHGDRAIVRQNALTNARSLVESVASFTRVSPENLIDDQVKEILRVARIFEAYSCGDLERQEVEKEIANEALEAVTKS